MSASPTYPVKTIARLLMISERRVQMLAKDGVIPKAERGRYELAPAVQGYIRYLQERVAGNASQVASVDYHVEKARKMKADADIAEIEAAKRRSEAIDAAEVKRAWQLILAEVRANLYGNTPGRIASLIVGVDDVTEVKEIVREEIGLAMQAAASADVGAILTRGDAGDGLQ